MPASVGQKQAVLPFSVEAGEEAQLLASYRSLIESIPGIVYTAELGEAGRWLYVSPQIRSILGWSAEEWCADPTMWFMQLHPADREHALADEHRSRTTGEPLKSEYRMIARGGEVMCFQDRATVVRDDFGHPALMHGVMLDVTERKRAEAALGEHRVRLAEAQRIAHIGSWEWDVQAKRLSMSDELHRITGVSASGFGGQFDVALALVHPDDRALTFRVAETALADGRPFAIELRIVRPDGQERLLDLRGELERDAHGAFVRALGTVQDITERKAVEAALRRSHDQFHSIIDNSPSLIYAKDRSFSYLFANRAFGRMLQMAPEQVMGRTDDSVLPLDVAGRARATDRAVLETGEALQEEEHVRRGEGDRTYLTQKFPLRDPQGSIYAVCAISTDITERKTREEELRAEVDWSIRVRDAVQNDRLVLHAQPILNLRTAAIEQEELLVRMRRAPGEPEMPPADFLPAAERFGLVQEIDRWVAARALGLARTRRVEVNLSGRSIGDRELMEVIEQGLRTHGTDPANLTFEITETAAAENMDAARDFAWRLKSLGCGFALDDFGTGYGSFTYLKHLPVDYIKIDLEFVRYLSIDPSDRKVVKSIIDVAKNFGVQTIAEGVEHQATLDLLRELEVDFAQGFLIGEPRPI